MAVCHVVYLKPYGRNTEVLKFILKAFPETDMKIIRKPVKLLLQGQVKSSIVYIYCKEIDVLDGNSSSKIKIVLRRQTGCKCASVQILR